LDSPVQVQATAVYFIGLRADSAIGRQGAEPLTVRPTIGIDAELGISSSVEFWGFYGGSKQDWSDPYRVTSLDISLKAFGGSGGFTISITDDGKFGLSQSGGIGPQVGGGVLLTPSVGLLSVPSKAFGWAMNDPITANGGTVANSTPIFANNIPRQQSSIHSGGTLPPLTKSTGIVANGFRSSQSVGAISHATTINQVQLTPVAPPSNIAGTTPILSASSFSGGGSKSSSSTASTQATSTQTTSSSSSSGGFFSNAWNWFTGLFHR